MVDDDRQKYFLQPGGIFVTSEPYLIHTVLGSCVSLCLWDAQLRQGGMNHYIYPQRPQGGPAQAKYGAIALTHLLKLMYNQGSDITNIKAHLIGGAQNPHFSDIGVGANNIKIGQEFIKRHQLAVMNVDVGGTMGRKVIFDAQTGEIIVYKVQRIRDEDWY